ncbi:MAG TPA: hypothetical protein VLJ14_13930 [Ktedonobacterales bacterium]|nr:hypothetical protein [Ktedonobacterales bacterium]
MAALIVGYRSVEWAARPGAEIAHKPLPRFTAGQAWIAGSDEF